MDRSLLRYIGVGLSILIIVLGLLNLVYSIGLGESVAGSLLTMVVALLALITLLTALSPEIVHKVLKDIDQKLDQLSSDVSAIRTDSTALKDIDLRVDNLSNDVRAIRADLAQIGSQANAVTNTTSKEIVVGWVCVTAGVVGLAIAIHRRSHKAKFNYE